MTMKTQLSKNFTLEEFLESEIDAKDDSFINTIQDNSHIDNLQALCANLLQPLRNALGIALSISSGYRCPELNEAAQGEDNSQHTKGQAADVYCKRQFRPIDIARMVVSLRLDFDQMILYPTFVHLSYTTERKNRKQILYNKLYKGENV
jgi:hypothetical protein